MAKRTVTKLPAAKSPVEKREAADAKRRVVIASGEQEARERKPPTNVSYKIVGNIATFAVDLSKPGPLSSTGKSILVGNSHGLQMFDEPGMEDWSWSVSVICKVPRDQRNKG